MGRPRNGRPVPANRSSPSAFVCPCDVNFTALLDRSRLFRGLRIGECIHSHNCACTDWHWIRRPDLDIDSAVA